MTDEEKKQRELDAEFATDINNLRNDVKTYGEKTEAEMKLLEERILEKHNKAEEKRNEELKTLKDAKEATEAELKEAFEKLNTKFTNLNLHGNKDEGGRTPEQKAELAALQDYALYDKQGLIKHDEKTYVIGTDPSAGYLSVPPYYANELIDQARLEISPVLSEVNVERVPANQFEVPTITGHAVASRVAETGTTSEDTTFAVGKEAIRPDYMTVLLKASKAMLSDSNFNIEGLFKSQVSNAFAKLLGTELFTGTGTGEMEGVTINSSITTNNVVNSGSATGLTDVTGTTKGILALFFNPKTSYMTNFKWYMRKATILACHSLKDGVGGPLLRSGATLENRPIFTMLGSPIVEAPDCPAIASDAYAIVWADLKEGFKVVDVEGMSVLRDDYTSKTTNVVEFMFWRRISGKTVNPESIHLLKIAA